MCKSIVTALALCSIAVSKAAAESDVDASGCPTKPIVIVYAGGRTANSIWEYITAYFAAKYLPNHLPYSMKHINELMGAVFHNVSLPVIEDVPKSCERIKDIDYKKQPVNANVWDFIPLSEAKEKFANFTGNMMMSTGTIMIEPMVIPEHLKEIKQVMPYKRWLLDEADKTLWKIKLDYFIRTGVDNITFVAVHARRTDYLNHAKTVNQTVVGASFFKMAIHYFRGRREELGDPVFVVASDDRNWTTENLETSEDIFITGGDAAVPAIDLVVLSSCNHSIYDYGTYGLWLSLYTEGEVVVTWQNANQQHRVLHKNPKWHFVDPHTNEFMKFP